MYDLYCTPVASLIKHLRVSQVLFHTKSFELTSNCFLKLISDQLRQFIFSLFFFSNILQVAMDVQDCDVYNLYTFLEHSLV